MSKQEMQLKEMLFEVPISFPVTQHIKLKTKFGKYCLANTLEVSETIKIDDAGFIYNKLEKPSYYSIVGGATEILTKIKLSNNENFFNNLIIDNVYINGFMIQNRCSYNQAKEAILSDINKLDIVKLSIKLYQYDVVFRCGIPFKEELWNNKQIIDEVTLLSDRSKKNLLAFFKNINHINLHPIFGSEEMNIKGDGDLIINDYLIDFKCKKDSKIDKNDLAQLTAYNFLKDSVDLDFKNIIIYNPRHGIISVLKNKND